jgi:NADH:ubiquinone oxidoreductase subunit K
MLVNQFLILAAVLFCIGVYGVIARRNAVMVLMSIERQCRWPRICVVHHCGCCG